MRVEIFPTEATSEKWKEKEEEVEDDEEVEQQEQGRRFAQSGQRAERRSLRHTGQTPARRRFDGCRGHFQTSSSSG